MTRFFIVLSLALVPMGCSGPSQPVGQFQSSLVKYEDQLQSRGATKISSEMRVSVKSDSDSMLIQHDVYDVQQNGLYVVQNQTMEAFAKDRKVKREYLFLKNPDYTAMLQLVEGRPNLQDVKQRTSARNRTPVFAGRPISELLKDPFIESCEVKELGGTVNVECVCDPDAEENKSQYESLSFEFENIGGFWLPLTVNAIYDGGNLKSDRCTYEWEVQNPCPSLRRTTQVSTLKNGSQKEKEITFTTQSMGSNMDESKCYLTAYGLIEPRFEEEKSPFGKWLAFSAVVVIVAFAGWKFVRPNSVKSN